jgi:hypothetical protein
MSKQEIKKERTVKDVLMNIRDIYIPLRYLPSKIRIPRNFIVARITLRYTLPARTREETFYFLVSRHAVIDMVNKRIYYMTRSGNIYAIPLTDDDLPKQLSKYVPGVDMLVISNRKETKGAVVVKEVSVLVNFNLVATFEGDIEAVNTEKFLASLLFNLYDDIMFYWNS